MIVWQKIFIKPVMIVCLKLFFCNKNNKDLLEYLIGVAIAKKVKVTDPKMQEVLKPNIFVRKKTLDIMTESTDKKEKYNIELNVGHYDGLNNRNAAYIFSKYSEDVKVREKYNNMSKYIQINLTSGLPKNHEIVNIYTLTDKETNRTFIENLIIYEFNLDKIKKMCYNKGEKEEYKILAALCCEKTELHKISKGNPILEKLESEVIRMNKDPEFIEFLSAEEDAKKVHNTLMDNAKKEGIEQNKIEIAKNMLKKGTDMEYISEVTGLTKEKIEKLK